MAGNVRIKDLPAGAPVADSAFAHDRVQDGARRATAAEIVALVTQVRAIECRWPKAATDALASDATAEREFYRNNSGVAILLTAILLNIHTTLAGHNTDTFTVIVRQRNGSGGAPATIVSWQNNVANGGLTALVTKDLGTLANASLPAGAILTVEITKQGTGQAVGAGCVECVGSVAA